MTNSISIWPGAADGEKACMQKFADCVIFLSEYFAYFTIRSMHHPSISTQ